MSDKMAAGLLLKTVAKQQSGDDNPVTGDPTPQRHGSRRQGRRDGTRGRLYL